MGSIPVSSTLEIEKTRTGWKITVRIVVLYI